MQYQTQTKIIKLLSLTTSNFDGEALNAVRKANETISSAGETWEDLINSSHHNRSDGYVVRKTKLISELRNRNNLLFAENELLKSDLRNCNAENELLKKQNETLKKWVADLEWAQKQIVDPSVKHMLELARRIRELERRSK